jgi:hypothetical protein
MAVLLVAAASIGYTAGKDPEPKGLSGPTYLSHVPEDVVSNNLGFGANKQRDFSHGIQARFGYSIGSSCSTPTAWSDATGYASGHAGKVMDSDSDDRFDFQKDLTKLWMYGWNPDMGEFRSNNGSGFFSIEALKKDRRSFPAHELGFVGLQFETDLGTYSGPTITLENMGIMGFPAFGQALGHTGQYLFTSEGNPSICIYNPVVIPIPAWEVLMKLELLQLQRDLFDFAPA